MTASELRYDAVLFDWMLTLVHFPTPAEHVRQALVAIDRDHGSSEVAEIVMRLQAADADPRIAELMQTEDESMRNHYDANYARFGVAGIDSALADALYERYGACDFYPMYPDTPHVLSQLRHRGVEIVVVSDIHVDLREHAVSLGIAPLVDDWVLSFEHGVQKPAAKMFELGLLRAGVPAGRTLMVGDRASHDGAASRLGIDSLILPSPAEHGERGLDKVLALVLGTVA